MNEKNWKVVREITSWIVWASVIAFILLFTVQYLLVDSPAQGQGNCSTGAVSKDESPPFEYHGSEVIVSVFVKSGQNCFKLTESNPSNGCYSATGLGTTNVVVKRIGSAGPDCQEISHVEFYAGIVPTDTDSLTQTPITPELTPVGQTLTPSLTAVGTETITITPEGTTETPPTATGTPDSPTNTPPSQTPADTPTQSETPFRDTETPTRTVTPEVSLTPTDETTPPQTRKSPTPEVMLPQTGFFEATGAESGYLIFPIAFVALLVIVLLIGWQRRKNG